MRKKRHPFVLTIAGSDPSAGAGLQADLLTFHSLGARGLTVVTALTAQDASGVRWTRALPAGDVGRQLKTVLKGFPVAAVKTGMLAESSIIRAVARELRKRKGIPLVVDPVLRSTGGRCLLKPSALRTLIQELIPLAAVITPNLDEAAALLDRRPIKDEKSMASCCAGLMGLKPKAVLLKGGHLPSAQSPDYLCDGRGPSRLPGARLRTGEVHGTGCVLSAALAVFLAQGCAMPEASRRARAFLRKRLRRSMDRPGPGRLF